MNSEKKLFNNNALLLSIVAIIFSYLLGNYFAHGASLLINKYGLPVFINTLVMTLTPPVFMLIGVALINFLAGSLREFLEICNFRNWRWFYIPEVIGIEIIFLSIAFSYGLIVVLLKKIFPFFFEFLKKSSNNSTLLIMESDWLSFTIFAAVAVIVAPVVEEIIFRGVMYNGLKKLTNQYAAVVITSLVFAAFHLNYIQFIPLFLLGLIFQILYIYHKSIFPGMVYHAIHNGFAMSCIFVIKFFNLQINI